MARVPGKLLIIWPQFGDPLQKVKQAKKPQVENMHLCENPMLCLPARGCSLSKFSCCTSCSLQRLTFNGTND